MRKIRLVVALAVSVPLLVSCGGDDADTAAPAAASPAASASPPAAAASAPAAAQPAAPVALTIRNFAFTPAQLTVKAGTQLSIKNEDSVGHTVTSAGNFDWSLPAGQTRTFQFDKPGTYAYICTPHPNMKGTLIFS